MKLTDKTAVELRRDFHSYPEVGWLEFRTTIKIIDFLKELGYELDYGKKIHSPSRMGLPSKEEAQQHLQGLALKANYDIEEILESYTGAVARLDTGRPGPKIGLRFDIDALRIEESQDQDHLPVKEGFVSKNTSSMHACGHDGHAAIGLDLARWLMDNKDQLSGSFVLIFQPAEEGVRGAKSMVEAGVLDGLDYLLGGHIGNSGDKDILGVGTRGFLATSKLDVSFTGIPSHAGASPEKGKNALIAAASATMALHSLTQFSTGMGRLNVGVLKAGSSRNIVASQALMQIETRGESQEINDQILARTYQVIEGTAQVFDLDYKIDLVGSSLAYSPKDQEFVSRMANQLEELGYETDTKRVLGGSEDISYMMTRVEDQGGKALHLNFGTKISGAAHHYRYDFDERVLGFAKKSLIDLIKILGDK